MIRKKIAFHIEGPDKNNGHLEMSVFVKKIKQFLSLLNRSLKESNEKEVVFHVVGLSHSSPAIIKCEPIGKDMKTSVAAFDTVGKNLNCVRTDNARILPNAVLSAMENLSKFNPAKIARAEIQMNGSGNGDGQTYRLDDKFRECLIKARNEEERLISNVDGKLEQINIHNKANKFTIYPTLPASSSVTCKFPQELLGDVQNALGSLVSVSGECVYRPNAILPYKIEVHEMEVLPPPEELPSLSDLFGIAPGMTGGKTSEQFVRENRDQWNQTEESQ